MPHLWTVNENEFFVVLHIGQHDFDAAEELSRWILQFDPTYEVGKSQIGPINNAANAKNVLDELNARSNHLHARATFFRPRLPSPIHEWIKRRGLTMPPQ